MLLLISLFPFFDDENILPGFPDFGFAFEVDIAFANSDLHQFLISCLGIPQI
jgi:hypothetical protein